MNLKNSIELNESDNFNVNKIINCDNQLNENFNQTTLQNDPFLSFLPYHFSTTVNNDKTVIIPTTTANQSANHTVNQSTNQTSNLTKMLLSSQDSGKFNKLANGELRSATVNNNQVATDLFQFHNSRSNSPSDYIKLEDNQNEQQAKISNQSISHQLNAAATPASISSSPIDSIINEKRLLSSQKLSGDDLLFSLTSDDLNDVINYFPLLNTELKEKSNFNCSPSLDSLNSGDSMFYSSWDNSSPQSNSSNNSSSNNNDLDLPFILNSDSNDLSATNQHNAEQSLLDSEFPFLSEDSMFNSFVNSNLNDLINGDDEFFINDDLQFDNNLNYFLNCSSFNSINNCETPFSNSKKLTRKPHCTLSKDSNLAKLLKEKLPIKLPSQSNQLKTTDNQLKTIKDEQSKDLPSINCNVNNNLIVNNHNNNLNSNSNATHKEVDFNKKSTNGLITRKFTIQGLSLNSLNSLNCLNNNDKAKNGSTGCLARSIKIIDSVGVQVANNNNVKYLLNNFNQNGLTTTTAAIATNQTTSGNGSFSLNITPANCLTVTSQQQPQSMNNQITTSNLNATPTKSFIIKSVDGKFANGILYTPIISSKNGTNITYTTSTVNQSQLALNNQTFTSNSNNKPKIMAAFTPQNLFLNNRKLVQKRPYSSMSVSISNQNNSIQTTNDLIDTVPKQFSNLAAGATFCSLNSQSLPPPLEMRKKIKTEIKTKNSNSKSYLEKNF